MLNVSSKPASKAKADNTDGPKRTWGPMTAIVLVLVSFLFIPVIVQLGLIFAPHILGWDKARADDWVLHSPLANFLYILITETLVIGMLVGFARFKEVAFRAMVALGKPRWRDIGRALFGLLVYFGLFFVVLAVVQQFVDLSSNQKQALGFEEGVGGAGLAMAFISLVVLPPIAEEILFRGFFYGTLRSRGVKMWTATILTSAFFASLHLFGSADGGLLWSAFVDVFTLSIVLCYLREETGSIWASIGVHALKNGLVFLKLFIIGPH